MPDKNVVDLESQKPHTTEKTHCLGCNHDWVAVYPVGTPALECPSCHETVPLDTYGTEVIGPFRGGLYKISSHGFLLPDIQAYKSATGWALCLDGRFEIDVSLAEIYRWAWFVGNAMAISAGYNSFGENSQPRNRFACRIGALDQSTA